MNERQLRYVETGLGGTSHGVPRPSQFIITAASEVMAALALASDLTDLKTRMGRIVVARDVDGRPITADDLQVTGAMTIVMKEAIKPNLVQTMEGQPVLVHAGPFGNIAHGANSLVADRVAVKMADYIVTEAGFASDLGFQKFCDIVCRIGKMQPNAAVLVTTVRATKSHGGVAFNDLGKPDQDALRRGADNLAQHVSIVKQYGLPCVVTINSFPTDTAEEVALVKELALKAGAETVVVHNGFGKGGEGAVDLAKAVVEVCEKPNTFKLLTPEGTGVVEQIDAIVKRVYGGAGIEMSEQATKDLATIEQLGLGKAPVCMAKSHMSLSHDAKLLNRPTGFVVPIRSLVASTGAGFVVAMCGEMQRMPGLGKTPAFQRMDIDANGHTVGLT
jgi:formate--tetrahydrofolate ligase